MVDRERSRISVNLYNRTVYLHGVSFPNELGSRVLQPPAEIKYSDKLFNGGKAYIKINKGFMDIPEEKRKEIFDQIVNLYGVEPTNVHWDDPTRLVYIAGREFVEALDRKFSSSR